MRGRDSREPWSRPISPTTRKPDTPMHRDTKLGLALAILVMGFAAALCFPRTPGEQTESLALQSAQELDSGIRLGQVKTYTDADRPKPPVPEAVEVTPSVPIVDTTMPAPSVTEVLPADNASVPAAALAQSEPTPVNPASFPAEVVAEPEQPVVHHKTYVVKHNDTLTSIAKEHLGAAGKWPEIFAANRDKLSGPESLRPAMVLVIPIPEDEEVTPSAPPPSAIAATQEAPPAAPATRSVPVSNVPRSNTNRTKLFSQPNRIGSNNAPKLQ